MVEVNVTGLKSLASWIRTQLTCAEVEVHILFYRARMEAQLHGVIDLS